MGGKDKKEKQGESEAPPQKLKGVYKNKDLWRARIWDVDKEYYLGHFSDLPAAAAAYDRACVCLRGWATASREGFNLNSAKYRSEASLLESRSIEQFALELRASGVQPSQELKLK